MTDSRIEIAQNFINSLPHCQRLGIKVLELDQGKAALTLPYSPELIGDPLTGVIHGGAVSTLLDTCCGAAVTCHPEGSGHTATLDLRIDYMRSAKPGQTITARAECYHVTRSVAFLRATATDGEGDTPVATAAGTFTFQRQTDDLTT